MRKTGIALAFAVAACASGVVAAPALAFGTFRASIKGQTLETEPGMAKGRGEITKLRLGPYNIECPKGFLAHSMVNQEASESFFTEVSFKTCTSVSRPVDGSGIEEIKSIRFNLGMEFLSNYSAKVGEGESEARIVKGSSVEFKDGAGKCVVVIPEQPLPLKQKAGVEYEAAVPETNEELLEHRAAIEKYGEYRKRLSFALDLRKIKSKLKPNAKCRYKEGSEEGKFNPETGYVEFTGGIIEGTLPEVTLKNGNLWFEE